MFQTENDEIVVIVRQESQDLTDALRSNILNKLFELNGQYQRQLGPIMNLLGAGKLCFAVK